MKLYCTVNKKHQITVNIDNGHLYTDKKEHPTELIRLDQNNYQMIKGNKPYAISVVSFDLKGAILKINGMDVSVEIKNHLDMLRSSASPKGTMAVAINEILAPMPGTILDVLVTGGQKVKKGDPLLILNAMKMENVIKSPSEATVFEVKITKDQNVNKQDVLITLK